MEKSMKAWLSSCLEPHAAVLGQWGEELKDLRFSYLEQCPAPAIQQTAIHLDNFEMHKCMWEQYMAG